MKHVFHLRLNGEAPDGPSKSASRASEVFYAQRGRHPVLMWVRTGVKRNGAITALHPAKPLDNTDLTLSDRKKMVRVHVARVLCQLAGLPDAL